MNICEDSPTDGWKKKNNFSRSLPTDGKKETISPEDYQSMISDRSNVNTDFTINGYNWNIRTRFISSYDAFEKLALMALEGLAGSVVKDAPGAMITPLAMPFCIIICHVSVIPRTLIHKKNPLLGMTKSTNPIKLQFYRFYSFFLFEILIDILR